MLSELSLRYRVADGRGFRLKHFRPGDTGKFKSKDKAEEPFQRAIEEIARLQRILYAQDRWALLLIFQGMDASGKDSVVRRVLKGLDPFGFLAQSFKAPTPEELDHDFLWRCCIRLPPRGVIGIFNRSYYEDVLIVRVHPEMLCRQKLPSVRATRRIWQERYEDIVAFERHLDRNGTVVRKFFLNVSPEEQRERLLARLERPEKHWKYNADDIAERELWPKYMDAYEQAIRHTATGFAPWYVVPADHKWFARLAVASVLVETLRSLRLKFPPMDDEQRESLASARKKLEKAR